MTQESKIAIYGLIVTDQFAGARGRNILRHLGLSEGDISAWEDLTDKVFKGVLEIKVKTQPEWTDYAGGKEISPYTDIRPVAEESRYEALLKDGTKYELARIEFAPPSRIQVLHVTVLGGTRRKVFSQNVHVHCDVVAQQVRDRYTFVEVDEITLLKFGQTA